VVRAGPSRAIWEGLHTAAGVPARHRWLTLTARAASVYRPGGPAARGKALLDTGRESFNRKARCTSQFCDPAFQEHKLQMQGQRSQVTEH